MPRKQVSRNQPLRAIADLTMEFLESRRGQWVSDGEVGEFVHGEIVRRLQSEAPSEVNETYDGGHWPIPGTGHVRSEQGKDAEPVRLMVSHILRNMALDQEIECRLFAPSGESEGGGFLYSRRQANAAPPG